MNYGKEFKNYTPISVDLEILLQFVVTLSKLIIDRWVEQTKQISKYFRISICL